MKKIFIGCGGLLGVLILIIVIVAVATGGSGSEPRESAPPTRSGSEPRESAPPTRLYDVIEIWNEYEANETRANQTYKGIWLTLRMERISKIESGGRVQMDVDTFGWNHIEFDFKNDDDVLPLNPGQSVTAICKLWGFQMDSWLNFRDCRFAQ